MPLRILIPPKMPSYIPKTVLGLPDLPFTNKEPYAQLKSRPEGRIKRATTLSGTGNSGFKLINQQGNPNGNRKTNRKSSKSSTSTKKNKAKKSKAGGNAKLLNGNGKKKTGIFQRIAKSSKKFLAKSSQVLGGQKRSKKLKRNKNGRFA